MGPGGHHVQVVGAAKGMAAGLMKRLQSLECLHFLCVGFKDDPRSLAGSQNVLIVVDLATLAKQSPRVDHWLGYPTDLKASFTSTCHNEPDKIRFWRPIHQFCRRGVIDGFESSVRSLAAPY